MSQQLSNYQVIEDNGGGIYLYWFDETGQVILGLENVEYAQPGSCDNMDFDDIRRWERQLDSPQSHYDELASYEFGWQVIADQDGIYSDRMGRAGQILYQVEQD
jgi:hypothetical protein